MYESKSGERGMFSRVACDNISQRNGRRGKKVTVTLEDGTKRTFAGNELVGDKLACELQEGDDA